MHSKCIGSFFSRTIFSLHYQGVGLIVGPVNDAWCWTITLSTKKWLNIILFKMCITFVLSTCHILMCFNSEGKYLLHVHLSRMHILILSGLTTFWQYDLDIGLGDIIMWFWTTPPFRWHYNLPQIRLIIDTQWHFWNYLQI
jgi:hypothetical protein